MIDPKGCHYCDSPRKGHGRRYVQVIGFHNWTKPFDLIALFNKLAVERYRHNVSQQRSIDQRLDRLDRRDARRAQRGFREFLTLFDETVVSRAPYR